MLAIEDDYEVVDLLSVSLMYKKINKIIDNMYSELDTIINNEIVDNIHRNSGLLYEIVEVDKILTKKQVASIMMNPNTRHSITFELTRNKTRLKNNIRRMLVDSIKNNSSLDVVNKKLKNLVYRKVYGKTKGDAVKTLRTFRTEYTRTRTEAKLEAIQDLQEQGYKITRHWLYTFESKVPRPSHLASDGLAEDKNGYFMIDGYKTKGPGLFGVASEDINCRCDTECYVTRPYDN